MYLPSYSMFSSGSGLKQRVIQSKWLPERWSLAHGECIALGKLGNTMPAVPSFKYVSLLHEKRRAGQSWERMNDHAH